jgi:hypothetical protein
MVHELGSEGRHSFFDLRLVAEVNPVYGRGQVHVFDAPCAEVVEDGDLMACRDVGVDDVRADESGSAADQDAHGLDCNGFTCWRWLRGRRWKST